MMKLPLGLTLALMLSHNVMAAGWVQLNAVQAPQYLELPAVVEAVSQATVSAQTSGRIIELPYDVNDLVPQGAVVVRFTDTEQKARLQKAQGAMTEAQSRFDEQQKELVRVQDIHSKGLVAKAALDLAQANYAAAKARLDQAKAAVTEAHEQLEQTVVRAPYSGILQQRFVEIGELAVPGKALLRGLSLENLRLVSQLPQSQLQGAQQSPAAELQLANGTVIHLGKPNMTIAPQANSQSHSFQLRLQLPAADYSQYLLLPGSWQRLRLQTGEVSQLQIPSSAVLWRGEVSAVWLKQGEQVMLQPVRLKQLSSDLYQVLSGLTAGAEIATDAQAQLAKQQAKQQGRSQP
ncbi:efflux RND transporter periplasmic adaptor subunit [Rheinheimera sp. 4Y26]|uniref:efflux RND transporter periplasmic adaptor subunit n=1 Tax=Rheinheimera sp. 4Y26 TaxID=2977811 RepID=UPI0021B0D82A|nr:efflux RND transporter periplasmic adaptor subunit [Rheinheimera sp. 4Y26]MCT6698026.1 efflux RND transporter periplasmic adaptor subunit [Rheinheimera sp. 4Y26]